MHPEVAEKGSWRRWYLKRVLKDEMIEVVRWWSRRETVFQEEGKACAKALRYCLASPLQMCLWLQTFSLIQLGLGFIILNIKHIQHAFPQVSLDIKSHVQQSNRPSCFWRLFNNRDQLCMFILWNNQKKLCINRKLRLEGNAPHMVSALIPECRDHGWSKIPSLLFLCTYHILFNIHISLISYKQSGRLFNNF